MIVYLVPNKTPLNLHNHFGSRALSMESLDTNDVSRLYSKLIKNPSTLTLPSGILNNY